MQPNAALIPFYLRLASVESAVEHAKEGVQQLEKAEQHQKNALPMRCIVALVVLIVIMLVILIAKHAPAQNNSNNR